MTAAICAWLLCNVPAWAVAPPPVEAFGNRPALIDIDINPAGTRLAWIEDDGRDAGIVIHDLTTQRDMRKIGVAKGTRLRSISWANDETVLIDQRITHAVDGKSRNAREWQRWTALDAGGGKDRLLLNQGGDREWVTGASLVRRRTAKAGKIYMSTFDFSEAAYRSETGSRLSGGKKDAGWSVNLYEVDLATGNGRAITNGSPFTSEWLVDESSERAVRIDWNPTRGEFEILVRRGSGWSRLYRSAGCGRMDLVSFNADNTAAILLGSPCEDTRSKLWSLPLDGSPVTVLLEDATADIGDVIRDPFDGHVLGGVIAGAARPVRWTDSRAESRAAALGRSFRTTDVHVVARSNDSQRVVVLVEQQQQAPVYYLVDYAAKTAEIVNEMYPQLAGVKLGMVREFKYAARDQYPLIAYLTVPPETPEKNLPLVVLPHGGPESHDDPGFDWMAQFFASRGYAVLQPQFRGSSGFGHEHADAGRRQWGLRMQDDVTDGVRAIIEAGIADPKRVCIVGWSYGGYAALAGAAFTPELYACAASIAGVSDLPAMITYTERMSGDESNSLAYWREHIGSALDPKVAARSPSRSAATIRAPILLLHGTDDTTVPIVQSQTMARALNAASRKYSLVELPGDDHQLSASVTRVRMLTEVEKFLWPYLAAPQPVAP